MLLSTTWRRCEARISKRGAPAVGIGPRSTSTPDYYSERTYLQADRERSQELITRCSFEVSLANVSALQRLNKGLRGADRVER